MLISVIYHSSFGHTAKQAEYIAEGAGRVAGAEINLIPLRDGDIPWATLEASDAIIFGAPTYNGAVSAKFKRFMEDSTKAAWSDQK